MKKILLIIPFLVLSCGNTPDKMYDFEVVATFKDGKKDTLNFQSDVFFISTKEQALENDCLYVSQSSSISYKAIAKNVTSVKIISKTEIK